MRNLFFTVIMGILGNLISQGIFGYYSKDFINLYRNIGIDSCGRMIYVMKEVMEDSIEKGIYVINNWSQFSIERSLDVILVGNYRYGKRDGFFYTYKPACCRKKRKVRDLFWFLGRVDVYMVGKKDELTVVQEAETCRKYRGAKYRDKFMKKLYCKEVTSYDRDKRDGIDLSLCGNGRLMGVGNYRDDTLVEWIIFDCTKRVKAYGRKIGLGDDYKMYLYTEEGEIERVYYYEGGLLKEVRYYGVYGNLVREEKGDFTMDELTQEKLRILYRDKKSWDDMMVKLKWLRIWDGKIRKYDYHSGLPWEECECKVGECKCWNVWKDKIPIRKEKRE